MQWYNQNQNCQNNIMQCKLNCNFTMAFKEEDVTICVYKENFIVATVGYI